MLCALALSVTIALAAGIETDPEFKQGQSQIDAFEYEKAAATFDKVSKRPSLPEADRALALVWLGLACAELRDQPRASVAFEDAVTADPLIVLPRDASPKIKALLEDARARVRLRPKTDTNGGSNSTTTTTTPTSTNTSTNATSTTTNASSTNPNPTVSTTVTPTTTSSLVPFAIGTAVVGGVVALAGGVVWGIGLALRQQAIDAPFQVDANNYLQASKGAQIGGQVGLGVGVVALVAGGALFAVGEVE